MSYSFDVPLLTDLILVMVIACAAEMTQLFLLIMDTTNINNKKMTIMLPRTGISWIDHDTGSMKKKERDGGFTTTQEDRIWMMAGLCGLGGVAVLEEKNDFY
jgi:hypothetical protein